MDECICASRICVDRLYIDLHNGGVDAVWYVDDMGQDTLVSPDAYFVEEDGKNSIKMQQVVAMIQTYLTHAKGCMDEGNDIEARNYINDALTQIKRVQET